MAKGRSGFKSLLHRLQRAGFSKRYLRSAFPSWWSREAEKEPGALLELKITLSKRLGLELNSLLNDDAELRVAYPETAKYKLRVGSDTSLLGPATASLSAIAKVVSAAASHLPSATPFRDPVLVRNDILESGARWPSFKAVLVWCWRSGIPVIPVLNLPGKQKMDAAVIFDGNRPVVLLTKNQPVSAWQLFILSHELGHLGSGHVMPEQTLIDDDLDQDRGTSDQLDGEERTADSWAKALLAGEVGIRFDLSGFWSPNGLAHAALAKGRELRIDPGHLILKVGFETRDWALANAALKVLEPQTRAIDLAREAAQEYLDFGALAEDSSEFLEQAVGLQERPTA
jgi:hypothetical protein